MSVTVPLCQSPTRFRPTRCQCCDQCVLGTRQDSSSYKAGTRRPRQSFRVRSKCTQYELTDRSPSLDYPALVAVDSFSEFFEGTMSSCSHDGTNDVMQQASRAFASALLPSHSEPRPPVAITMNSNTSGRCT